MVAHDPDKPSISYGFLYSEIPERLIPFLSPLSHQQGFPTDTQKKKHPFPTVSVFVPLTFRPVEGFPWVPTRHVPPVWQKVSADRIRASGKSIAASGVAPSERTNLETAWKTGELLRVGMEIPVLHCSWHVFLVFQFFGSVHFYWWSAKKQSGLLPYQE